MSKRRNKDDPPQRLKYLRISSSSSKSAFTNHRNASLGGVGPCADHLAALLSCWRSNGVDAARCADSVALLSSCANAMQQSAKSADPLQSINRTLASYFRKYLR